jgi:hypothetical protein
MDRFEQPAPPPVDPRIEENRRKREEWERKKAEMESQKLKLQEEQARLDQEIARINEEIGNAREKTVAKSGVRVGPDFTTLPTELDARLEKLDPDSALRPTIINVGKTWSKKSQKGLLANAQTESVGTDKQKIEKNTCMDLLDALTQSGGLSIEGASLHIVVASTHCFGKNLMSTLVQDNVNPIDKMERSELIVAEMVHGKKAEEMLKRREVNRIKEHVPALFEK